MAGLSNAATFNSGINPRFNRREDLFSTKEVKELNTYSTWEEIVLNNDVSDLAFRTEKDSKGNEIVKEIRPDRYGTGIKSIFNKYTLVPVLNQEVRAKMNAPLVDSPEMRKRIKSYSDPSIKNLVEKSRSGVLGRETYQYSDFMYCKYLGQMPNNYMITLRRFPIACNDYIGQLLNDGVTGEERELAAPLGCLVTWLGTPGNEMEDILKYTVSMPFKEVTAKMEHITINDQSSKLGNMFAAFDSKYQKQVQEGTASASNPTNGFTEKLLGAAGMKNIRTDAPYQDHLTFRDDNKIYGPVDRVKDTSMRSEDGLKFSHSFNLRFEYELRSYSNINARQAMLDLIGNILTVTYANGSFWPGGYKGWGVHQSDLFSNLNVMKAKGGFTSYMDALANDISTVGSSISASIKKQGGLLETLKNLANNFGGMLLGGMLNALGRPQKQAVNSLLSPAPVGLWHVTVGNPFHPIMSIGNLILEDATITHQGPLGLDDFPTKLVVDCKLKRAKGRDSNDIERMYNYGVSRIYSGLDDKTEYLIKTAPSYRSKNKQQKDLNQEFKESSEKLLDSVTHAVVSTKSELVNFMADEKLEPFKRHFNTTSVDAVQYAGMEWLRGAGVKTKDASKGT